MNFSKVTNFTKFTKSPGGYRKNVCPVAGNRVGVEEAKGQEEVLQRAMPF